MHDKLLPERIEAFYAQAPGAGRTNGGLAVVAGAVMWSSAPAPWLWGWLAAVAASLALRFGLHAAWKRDPARREHAAQWASRCTLAMFASGAVWGGGGVLMFNAAQPLLQAFWLIMLCGIAAGVVAGNAFHRPAQVAYLVPLLLPVTLRAMLEGTREQWAIAIGMGLFLAFTLVQGRHQAKLIADSIAQRLENLDLVARLREERLAADAARQRAEGAAQAEARFFAAASHDLRQPLHALSLFAGALAADASAAVRDKAGKIGRSVEALATLFDHILDSARLDAGALKPQPRAFPVQDLLDAVTADHAEVARAKGLRFRVHPCKAWVHTDPDLLRRVLGNLAANAIRYTPAGGILVGCRRRDGRLAIEVRDAGIGIDLRHHGAVFEDFFQVDNPGRDRNRGSGLGLATVKRIASVLDAPLALRSAPGRGSAFSIALPLAPRGAASPAAGRDEGPALGADPLRGRVLLVVDDDRIAREGLVAMLERWGIEVKACASASELAALPDLPAPDAILADWRLGAGTGLDAIHDARRRWNGLPALIVTGEQVLGSEATEGIPVLRKPARPVQLRAALLHVLHVAAVPA